MPISNQKRFVEALKSFEQAIRINSIEREAWYNRAKTYQQFGKLNDCVRSFEIAMRTDKKEFEDKFYIEVIKLCNIILSKDKRNIFALRTKASALIHINDYEKAYILIDKILKLRSDDFPTLTLASLALSFNPHVEIETQLVYVDKALRMKDSYAFAWYVKGLILHSKRHYSEAIVCFNNALGVNINYTDAVEKRIESIKALEERREENLRDQEPEDELMSTLEEEVF
jgi:tetratricopeptide (TPR) repeat protein